MFKRIILKWLGQVPNSPLCRESIQDALAHSDAILKRMQASYEQVGMMPRMLEQVKTARAKIKFACYWLSHTSGTKYDLIVKEADTAFQFSAPINSKALHMQHCGRWNRQPATKDEKNSMEG